jgi:hypothetical protein
MFWHRENGHTAMPTFSSSGGISFGRSTPVAALDVEVRVAINVIDADGVAYSTNPARFGQVSAGADMAFSAGNDMRFGRLRLIGA